MPSFGFLEKDKMVAAICRRGVRSQPAVPLLQSNGIDARSISGGMMTWARSGLPVTPGGSREGGGRQ